MVVFSRRARDGVVELDKDLAARDRQGFGKAHLHDHAWDFRPHDDRLIRAQGADGAQGVDDRRGADSLHFNGNGLLSGGHLRRRLR